MHFMPEGLFSADVSAEAEWISGTEALVPARIIATEGTIARETTVTITPRVDSLPWLATVPAILTVLSVQAAESPWAELGIEQNTEGLLSLLPAMYGSNTVRLRVDPRSDLRLDVDRDGLVSGQDVRILLRYLTGLRGAELGSDVDQAALPQLLRLHLGGQSADR